MTAAKATDCIGTKKNPRQFPAGGSLWRLLVGRSGSEVALNANVERQGVNDPERTGGAVARPLVQVRLVTRIQRDE